VWLSSDLRGSARTTARRLSGLTRNRQNNEQCSCYYQVSASVDNIWWFNIFFDIYPVRRSEIPMIIALAVVVLAILFSCGGCVYLFSDSGLEPPPTISPTQ